MANTRYPKLDKWHVVGASGEPAFVNSWVAYGGAFAPPAFRRDQNGLVTITGMMAKGGGNWAVETVFTLPVGYRPPYTLLYSMKCQGTSISVGRIDITAAGLVSIQQGAADNPVAWATLEGIQFYAAGY